MLFSLGLHWEYQGVSGEMHERISSLACVRML